jgi:enterochelin esterase family protein
MGVGIKEDPYYDVLFNDIMPYIEKQYHVSNKRFDRAFAGLSMGGLQALNIGLFAPEKFGYVLPLSTGYFPGQLKELEEKYATVLSNPTINEYKLFWIAMGGKEDIAYQNGENMKTVFDKFKIKYTTHNYDGAHSFLTWRHDLADFAPLLFK